MSLDALVFVKTQQLMESGLLILPHDQEADRQAIESSSDTVVRLGFWVQVSSHYQSPTQITKTKKGDGKPLINNKLEIWSVLLCICAA